MTESPSYTWTDADRDLLLETSRDFASSRDLPTLLERLSQRLLEVVPAGRSGILLLDEGEESQWITLAAGHVVGRGVEGPAVPRRLDPAAYPELSHLRATGRPLVVPEVREHPVLSPVRARLETAGLRSLLCVPLRTPDAFLGMLSIGTFEAPRSFSDREIALCQTIANQAAVAVENARLYEELRDLNRDLEAQVSRRTARLRRSLRHLAVINEIVHDVATSLRTEDLARRAVELLRERFDLYAALIAFHEEKRDRFRIIASCSQPPLAEKLGDLEQGLDEGICGWVVTNNRSYVTGDVSRDPYYLATPLRDTRSELCVPLRIGAKVVGVVDVQSDQPDAFHDEDRVTLEVLADTLGVAVRTAELFTHAERSRAFTEAVVENLTGGLLVLDSKGVVRRANQRACAILGLEPEAIRGRPLLEAFPEAEPLLEYAPAGPPRELELRRGDGSRVPIGYSNAFFASREGTMDAVLVSFQDLSEVKALQAQVRHRERLATIGQVAAAFAHEIRNPLFGITSTAQTLHRDLGGASEGGGELLEVLLGETRRLDRLVEQLLTYGKPAAPQIRSQDLAELWRELIDLEREVAHERGVRIEADLPESLEILCDGDQIKAACLNLLRNGLHAADSRLWVGLARENGMAVARVEDDGPGVPDDDRERIFDLYFTTKGSGGSGMGLALCRKAAREHGGEVECLPRERGACFRISLPLRPSGPAHEAGGDRPAGKD